MLIAILLLVVGFPTGAYLVHRSAPPLAGSTTGRMAARTTELLGGAALAALALHAHLAIRVLTEEDYDGFSRLEPLTYALTEGLWQAGLLLAAAAAVHLLAPGDESGDD